MLSDISKEEKKKIKKDLKKLNKQNKTNDRINDRQLVGYARENETDLKKERRKQEKENKKAEKEKEKNRAEKGKLSTLVDIMKNVEVSVAAEIYGDTKLELTRDFIENTAALAKQYKDLYEKVK